MQQKTLDLVGRRHTVEQTVAAFELARRLGFDNINMDLIAGLPGETVEDMEDTLRQVEALLSRQPDRPCACHQARGKVRTGGAYGRSPRGDIGMVEKAYESARRMGLLPYYLYRQKNIAGILKMWAMQNLTKPNIQYTDYGRKTDHPCCGSGSIYKDPAAEPDHKGWRKRSESGPRGKRKEHQRLHRADR